MDLDFYVRVRTCKKTRNWKTALKFPLCRKQLRSMHFIDQRVQIHGTQKNIPMKLSKHIWLLKDNHRRYSIKWSVVKQLKARKTAPRNCLLWLQERFLILKERRNNILNKQSHMHSL